MHSLKTYARRTYHAILTLRRRLAQFLLEDLSRRANRGARRLSLCWLLAFCVYCVKRWGQGLVRGRPVWRAEERIVWWREVRAQFLQKLCHWEQIHVPYHPFAAHGANHRLTDADRQSMRKRMARFEETPLISIIVPVHNSRAEWLERLFRSVSAQIYDRWELVLVDDGSTLGETRRALLRISNQDDRVILETMERNGGVVAASNRGCALANGSFLAFLDHDDELTADALWCVVERLQAEPDCDLIYSDEELVPEDGKAYATFKPDFSPELLTAYNYMCHLLVVRKSMFDAVGGFRRGTDGAQDYDLVLRVIHATSRVAHIARILYRWHVVPRSMSREVEPKTKWFRQVSSIDPVTRAVVQAHLDRFGVPAQATIVEALVAPRLLARRSGESEHHRLQQGPPAPALSPGSID
ncbi:MAG: glycosyltransferase [Planctomycetota bacterium]